MWIPKRHLRFALTEGSKIRKIEYMRRCLPLILAFSLSCPLMHADGPPFDLSGPKVDVHVKRGEVTLPVSETPNLWPGDRLWIHPDLPESQGAHFVLVIAFLRGSTNPPPPEWFTRVETWTRDVRDEGIFVTVPREAQQALLFLAPETGGDFNTLRNSVRGRPGSFVRAAQDLQAASWERMRLDDYLDDVKVTSQFDPAALKTRTEMAARSLGIKINESCFAKPPDEQAPCLSQNSEGMVLDDANAQSLVDQLASGSTLDLMNQLSSTPRAGGGVYSPYVGAIVDTAKILASLHTAHFQYIPALALPKEDALNLRLNMPPSFVNPKSVVVVALPPIGPARPEPLHAVDPSLSFCASKPGLVLPAEGAPLVFATEMAHDLSLRIAGGDAKKIALDVPIAADAAQGGLIPTQPLPALPGGELTVQVRGKWGFDDWEGPQFKLVVAQPGKWALGPGDESALVVGRDDTLHIEGPSAVCVDKVKAEFGGNHPLPVTWKPVKAGALEVNMPLKDAGPGPVNLTIYQLGLTAPDRLSMVAYAAAAALDSLTLNCGDKTALLKGTRLDEVAKAEVSGITFTPSALNHVDNLDELLLTAAGATSSLEPGRPYVGHVELRDGRMLSSPVSVSPPRPEVALLSKGIQDDSSAAPLPVQFGSSNDLPIEDHLVFFLKSSVPASFPRDEKVELAAADSSFHAVLTVSDGSLMLENADTAMASVDPLTRFGSSAFGPVRVRPIAADGAAGDWVPLGTFVRVPGFRELRCPRSTSKPCILSGANLFLAYAIAATPDFDNPTDVAPEFTGTQLVVPHPSNGVLYLKLRDDPATVQTLTLPVTTISLAESKTLPATIAPNGALPASPSSAETVTGAPQTASPAPQAASTAPSAQVPASPGAPAQTAPPNSK